MIRIIDRTLVQLEAFDLSDAALHEIADLLCLSGANYLEISPAMYGRLQGVAGAQYILRLDTPQDARAFAEQTDIRRFVCKGRADTALRVYPEITVNDMRDFFTVERFRQCDRVRVYGLADSVLQPLQKVFQNLRNAFEGTIEFCADNDCYCATSLTLQWVQQGGNEVVTSFFGMGSMAAFENVTRLLYHLKGRRTRSAIAALKRLEALMRKLLTECESA
ncbi:MAG TPA: hypothetical protein PKU80_11750 [Candidatus Limiplasma sp.]|nr:hypothetical protein [Candidatus Limiplasma sp.]HRX09530.1 hypothetical protein [Candidatus Limiplasma sp.]